MKLRIEVRAYVVDNYGHEWELKQLHNGEFAKATEKHPDLKGMPTVFTLSQMPKIEVWPAHG